MSRKKIKNISNQRPYVMIYHDFLESDILTTHEKMLFIALKKFADSKNQCFPSLKKLSGITGISRRKIQDTLKQLEQKHIIDITCRANTNGGNTSNFYTLYDFQELWNNGSNEKAPEIINQITEEQMIELLTAKGYCVTKEKEPASELTRETDADPVKKQNYKINDTVQTRKSQVVDRYTMKQIRQLFDYDIMIKDSPHQQNDIDAVMDILYTAMNTDKPAIRISGENKASMSVISKLMKLNKESILYAIDKFSEQTDRIKNPELYMLTILYHAPEQFHFDIKNQAAHDMYPEDQTCSRNINYRNPVPHQRTYDYDKLEKILLAT